MTESFHTHYTPLSSEKLNKKFYHHFKSEHASVCKQLQSVSSETDLSAYTTVLLLRILVLHFLQAQRLLDQDPNYLFNHLRYMQQQPDPKCFYREYLLPLFTALYTGQLAIVYASSWFGHLPKLDIPLFAPLPIELSSNQLTISNATLLHLFDFLHSYQWQLNPQQRPGENTLLPSVLAYIFEQESDQKQTGTYYTQDDIANYIASATIIPRLLTMVEEQRPGTFAPQAPYWNLLRAFPNRYIRAQLSTTDYLPTETEREHVLRLQRYQTLFSQLRTGSVHDIIDLITSHLDLQRFISDSIMNSTPLELPLLLLEQLEQLTILDPTCGSGAFLLAAQALLQHLYSLCIERLESYNTTGKKHPHTLALQARMGQYPTRKHYIMTLILTKNLYGVDLEPEAIAICQLRLQLAFLAHVNRIEDVPSFTTLPLQLRIGNALVGELRPPLSTLPVQSSKKTPPIQSLPRETPPFHWHQVFPSIFTRGGFEVIIGNPPYVEHSKIKQTYRVEGYANKSCGNIYAAILERSLALCRPDKGYLGLIVPISLCGSQRFEPLRLHLQHTTHACWLANFEIFPSRLFEGAFQRLSILLAHHRQASTNPETLALYVTKIHRWYSAERPHLLALLHYTRVQNLLIPTNTFPKLASSSQELLLAKVQAKTGKTTIGKIADGQPTAHFVYYQEATNYWTKAVCHIPFYQKNGQIMTPPHGRFLFFDNQQAAHTTMALLNSALFYIWFSTYSDGFHLSHALVKSFPLHTDLIHSSALQTLSLRLETDILHHARRGTRNTKSQSHQTTTGHSIELAEYYMRYSKPILDEIDRLLAAYYDFTAEELDFVLYYESKHRISQQRI